VPQRQGIEGTGKDGDLGGGSRHVNLM
jgi:hypothetical protein